MSPSIFTKIVRGEVPAHRVWEDEEFLAFLDTRPVRPGHVLLIPKREVDYVFDLPGELYARLWERARRLAGALREATGAARIGIAVEGLSVPHVHVHLVPVSRPGDLDPSKQRPVPDEELARMAEAIRASLGKADPVP
jgi:histidine triad (HIT) family protein